MRHGAASALLADGVTPAVVQRQLRHSDPRIRGGYTAGDDDHQRQAEKFRFRFPFWRGKDDPVHRVLPRGGGGCG